VANWPTLATTIPDLIIKVLAPAMPEKVRGGHFGDSMAHFFFGKNPKTGEFYINSEPDAGGYGGKNGHDGESALHSMTLGDTLNLSAEVAEARFPFRISKVELIRDSGGPGKYRGGLGCRRQYEFDNEAGLTVTSDRIVNTPPWGLFGGKAGRPSITKIFRKDGSLETYRKTSGTKLHAGDAIAFEPGGGGGYGAPEQRDPALILEDILNDYISPQAAAADYGVIVDTEKMCIDEAATKAARASLFHV
jgi:N-methylhydantoinase B